MLMVDIWYVGIDPLLAFFCALSRTRDRFQEYYKNNSINTAN